MAEVEAPRAPRDLVVCCDGTNNTLTAGMRDTNVLLLYEHLARHPAPHRLLYYDPGVGTPDVIPPTDPIDWLSRTWERVSGLASGRGVYDNIGEAYLFLMRHWRDERDRIYAFGFSRGAFTARCVVGMVNLFGVLEPAHEVLLPTLVRIYFSLPPDRDGTLLQEATRWLHRASAKETKAAVEVAGVHAASPYVTRRELAEQIRRLFTSPAGACAAVHWVGVWDTVESVGLPGPLARSNPSTATLRGKRIAHVRHALAFDEHRWTFAPRLYEEPGDIDEDGRTLRQRWFPGVHCDVGGSYPGPEAGLADAALAWMVNEVAADLGIPPMAPAPAVPLRHDALWDTPWWALAGMCLRDMRPRTRAPRHRQGQGGEVAIAVIPAPNVERPLPSVWERRRPLWPVAVALLVGALCLSLSGACLTPAGWLGLATLPAWHDALAAGAAFAGDQAASLWLAGLFEPDRWAAWGRLQPAWAMLWDFGFMAGWGYLLARVASRAFAWLAGARNPDSGAPAWRLLGMAPLAALGGDALENLFTLAALALDGIGAGPLVASALFCTGAAAMVKWAGLLGCVPLVAVRLWIVMPGVPRFGRTAASHDRG